MSVLYYVMINIHVKYILDMAINPKLGNNH